MGDSHDKGARSRAGHRLRCWLVRVVFRALAFLRFASHDVPVPDATEPRLYLLDSFGADPRLAALEVALHVACRQAQRVENVFEH